MLPLQACLSEIRLKRYDYVMKRYRVIVDGIVQGVGFRYFCMYTAKDCLVTGSVRNMSNGMVDIYVQGEEENINTFLDKVKEGIGFIRVDDMRIKPVPVVEGEREFVCLYSEDW